MVNATLLLKDIYRRSFFLIGRHVSFYGQCFGLLVISSLGFKARIALFSLDHLFSLDVSHFPARRARRREEAWWRLLALLDLRRIALRAFFPGSASARAASLSALSWAAPGLLHNVHSLKFTWRATPVDLLMASMVANRWPPLIPTIAHFYPSVSLYFALLYRWTLMLTRGSSSVNAWCLIGADIAHIEALRRYNIEAQNYHY